MFIYPDNKALQYSGRIDFEDPKAPVFIYAASYVKVKFTGRTCKAKIANKRCWAISSVGVIIDGKQGKLILEEDSNVHEYDLVADLLSIDVDPADGTLALNSPFSCIDESDVIALEDADKDSEDKDSEDKDSEDKDSADKDSDVKDFCERVMQLDDGEHELILFKRMDGGAHYFTFHGFEFDDGATVSAPAALQGRRMEVIGDSVSCGEVCEAVHCVANKDPEDADGFYSNSWFSYSWQVARNVGAELHDTSQGGIALFDKTGWFNGPDDFRGVLSSFDKLEYNPALPMKNYDLSSWKPQVIILAIGQNDANPKDIMKDDYDGEAAQNWRAEYRKFILHLQEIYPGVTVICATTVLMHDANWDKAIDEVVREINAETGADADSCAGSSANSGAGSSANTSSKAGADASAKAGADASAKAGADASANSPAKVYHYMYKRVGAATPGHPRIPEHNEMAAEMSAFIESLGESIWQ